MTAKDTGWRKSACPKESSYGGRGCVPRAGGAYVAPGERTEIKNIFTPLRSRRTWCILRFNDGTQIPGKDGHDGRYPLYPGTDRGTPTGEPTAAVGEVVRSLAVEASQRRLAGYGLPRSAADAGPRRGDRVAGGEVRAPQPVRRARSAGADAG